MAQGIKDKYIGRFNFQREIYIEYAYAFSPLQAKMVIMRRIAKKQDVPFFTVYNFFNENKDNWEIQLETEFREGE
jgi:hypothetical protein